MPPHRRCLRRTATLIGSWVLLVASGGCTPPEATETDKVSENSPDTSGGRTDSGGEDSAGDSADTALQEIVLADNLRVLDEADAAALIRVENDGATLVFSSLPTSIATLSAGDLLAGGPSGLLPYGLLSFVDAVVEQGGETRVSVRQAPLSAAIVRGSLTFEAPISTATLVSATPLVDGVVMGSAFAPPPAEISADLIAELPNYVLYDYDGDNGTTDDQVSVATTLAFGTTLNLSMSFEDHAVETFDLTSETSISAQTTLAATTPGLSVEESTDIGTWEFAPVTFWIPFGPIVLPVTLVPTATAYVGGSIDVEASMTVVGDASITATTDVAYADEAWTMGADVTPTASASITPHLSGDAKAYVGVRTDLLFYGVTGPQLNGWTYVHGQASTDTAPCWQFGMGDAIDASFNFSVISDAWTDVATWHVYDEETPYAESSETPETWYLDGDLDGFGDDAFSVLTCWGGDGFSMTAGDCDDSDAGVNPLGIEVCDGVDNNCDDSTDGPDAAGLFDWYGDADGDGYGVADDYQAACAAPAGYVDGTGGLDCDDAAADINPGEGEAGEVCSDGLDQDCDGAIDCADADCIATPGVEACGSSVDEDCDGAVDCDDTECAFDAVCPGCGNGVIDSGEDCDGAELGGLGCVDIGFDSGTLACDSACFFEEAGCASVEDCADGVDNDGDGGVDCDDLECSGDAGCVAATAISLADASAKYTGEAGDQAGLGVAVVGDVNGDAYDDLVVGAFQNDDEAIGGGATFLVLGSASPVSSNLTLVDAEFTGSTTATYTGFSLAAGGDVDGDGYADLLIGMDPSHGSAVTEAYLILGSAAPASLSLSAANAIYAGDGTDGAGAAVAGAGDVNGDGFDDQVIGGPYWGGGLAGAAWLVVGSTTSTSRPLSTADAQFTGDNERAGNAVDGAGDVNADGFDDLIVGAVECTNSGVRTGAAYLILGETSPSSVTLSSGATQYLGVSMYDNAGYAVSGVGDTNNDGYHDVLIGAPGYLGGSGVAYLILGSSSPTGGSLSAADAVYSGEATMDRAGASVSAAGDIDRDGFADLLIGANYRSNTASIAGGAYLIMGQATPSPISLADADYEFLGEAAGDLAGTSVSGGGDIDLDGNPDLLIGAWDNAGGGAGAGAAYLILGSSL